MMSRLERDAARALFSARRFSAAVNRSEGWQMQWGDVVVDAQRIVVEDAVALASSFPATCYIGDRPQGPLTLLLDGEPMGFKDVEHPGDTDASIDVVWEISVPESVGG